MKTLWEQLTPAERAEWLASAPEQAMASRDGREPEPVAFPIEMPPKPKPWPPAPWEK